MHTEIQKTEYKKLGASGPVCASQCHTQVHPQERETPSILPAGSGTGSLFFRTRYATPAFFSRLLPLPVLDGEQGQLGTWTRSGRGFSRPTITPIRGCSMYIFTSKLESLSTMTYRGSSEEKAIIERLRKLYGCSGSAVVRIALRVADELSMCPTIVEAKARVKANSVTRHVTRGDQP